MVTSCIPDITIASYFLLGIQLDDQLFVDFFRNIVTLRVGEEFSFHTIRVPLQPWEFSYIRLGGYVVSDQFDVLGFGSDGNYITWLQLI